MWVSRLHLCVYFLVYKTICYVVFRSVNPLVALVVLSDEPLRYFPLVGRLRGQVEADEAAWSELAGREGDTYAEVRQLADDEDGHHGDQHQRQVLATATAARTQHTVVVNY